MSKPIRPFAVLFMLLSAAAFLALLALASPVQAVGTNTLHLPAANVAPNQEVTVTLALTYGQGSIYSADIRVTYDPALLTVVRVTKGSAVSSANWSLYSNVATIGLIQAGLATGGAPLTASGDLLYLTFRAGSQIDASPLTITQGSLNEGNVAATLQDGSLNINTAPVARTDGYTTDEDTPLTVAATGVLSNDSDADGHALAASMGTGPSHGQVSLAADGAVVYTPTLNFFGVDAFTYSIADGNSGSASATVNITVTAVNDLPTAQAGGPYTVDEGSTVALDGSASADVEDAAGSLTYEWDLDNNDSFETTGAAPTFSAAGKDGPATANARLRVRDTQAGLSQVNTATVTIRNVAPTANPGGPYTVAAESNLQLNGASSSDPGGAGDPLAYGWDWGNDGSTDATGVQPTYSTAGLEDTTILVGLVVTDDDGAASTVVTTTLRVLPLPRWSIAGQVTFWRGGAALPNVRLDLQGFRVLSGTNQSNGAFTLSSVPQGSYTLTASKSDQANGITAYDAALTLQHVSGVSLLSGDAALAADANQQAGISALDASLILQKSVDLIPVPFPGAGQVWKFTPATRTYGDLAANENGQDFTAILLGDPSGNWASAATRAAATAEDAALVLRVAPAVGDVVTATLWLAATAAPVHAVDVTLQAAGAVVQGVAVELDPQVAGWIKAANVQADGRIQLAIAGAQPMTGAGALAVLRFTRAQPGTSLQLTPLAGALDEAPVAVRVEMAPQNAIRSIFLPLTQR